MPDKKITELSPIVTISSGDVFSIVDISDNTTKKIDITQIKAQSPVQSVNATTGDVTVQATLVSGTNIKTINSNSILGSGNLVVAAAPSGVSGSVQFSNGSAFASDATNFFWDDTNDRLGIGTNTPSDRLTILGNSTSPIRASLRNTNANGDTQISLKNDTTGAAGFQVTGTTYFGNPSAYFFTQGGLEKLSFTTDGDLAAGGSGFITFLTGGYNASQERMRILSTGNIGINSTTATSKLVIKGSGTTSGTSSLNVTDSSANSILFVRDDGKVAVNTATPVAGIALTINDFFGGGLVFQTNGSTKTYFVLESVTNGWINGSVAGDLCLRHTNHNILIGYSTGAQIKVRPTGDTYIGYTPPVTANYGALNLGDGLFTGAANSFSGVAAGTALAMNFLSGATSDFINLEKTGLARFKVTHDGNVGVGLDSPTAKIHVIGSGATNATSSLNIVNSASTSLLYVGDDGNIGIGTNAPAAKLSVKGNGTTTATRNTQWLNSAGSDIGALNDAGNVSFTGKGSFGNAGSGSILNIRGSGATSATSSVSVINSSSSQTFSVRDDGVVFVGLTGLAVGSAKFQVKDQSDNICISVAQSDILFGNSAVLRSNDGIMYPTGNITFRNGNPNSAVINFGDSEVNSVSATGVFSFIKFTRNWTSVAPSLNLTINVQETQNVINMTNGTGTKIFRGIYHNPTVTAVTSHRAFESSSGGGYFNTTSVDASSVLQADSTTQGFLPPRMTNAQRAAIVSPAEGLLVHNTTNKGTAYYDGTNWGYLNGAAQTVAGSGGTVNIPFGSGNIVDLTLTASTTLTLSGHVVGVYILKVIQGGTGSYTLTFPASVKWSGGTPPTLTTTVGKTDIITLFHDGTNFFGTYSLNY